MTPESYLPNRLPKVPDADYIQNAQLFDMTPPNRAALEGFSNFDAYNEWLSNSQYGPIVLRLNHPVLKGEEILFEYDFQSAELGNPVQSPVSQLAGTPKEPVADMELEEDVDEDESEGEAENEPEVENAEDVEKEPEGENAEDVEKESEGENAEDVENESGREEAEQPQKFLNKERQPETRSCADCSRIVQGDCCCSMCGGWLHAFDCLAKPGTQTEDATSKVRTCRTCASSSQLEVESTIHKKARTPRPTAKLFGQPDSGAKSIGGSQKPKAPAAGQKRKEPPVSKAKALFEKGKKKTSVPDSIIAKGMMKVTKNTNKQKMLERLNEEQKADAYDDSLY